MDKIYCTNCGQLDNECICDALSYISTHTSLICPECHKIHSYKNSNIIKDDNKEYVRCFYCNNKFEIIS